jgi:integrase
MPFPSRLHFVERHASKAGKHFFQCCRSKEHPEGRAKIRMKFKSKADYERYVLRHDAKFHDRDLARHLRLGVSPTLGELVTTFLERLEARWRAGEADAKTILYYQTICRHLLTHFGEELESESIDSAAIMRYVDARRSEDPAEGKQRTAGARIRKEVSALGTIFRDSGIPVRWALRRDAIRAAKRVRPEIGVETIRRFIAAMKPASVEWKFCVVKFSTAMRSEELYAANVGDVDMGERVIVYRLRNKRGEHVEHAAALNDLAAAAIRPLIAGRPPDAPLFTLRGRRLAHSSLRKRFIKASIVATEALRKKDPAAPAISITSVGSFRREAGSAVMEELQSTYPVTEHFGHRTEGTTRKHYKVTRRTEVLGHSRDFARITGDILGAGKGVD